jgi:hypothetical protein
MINYWTEAEIAMLRENILPPGRKLKSAYTKAFRLGICFCPVTKKSFKAQRAQAAYVTGSVIRELQKTGKVRATARKYGISYTTVMEIARKAGIKVNPDSLQKRAETIVFEGRNYAWHDSGYYWRCTTGKRESLARVLYERAHGPIDGRMIVTFKDGNKYNLDVDNLICVTPSEQGRMHYENDPLFRAQCLVALTLGRLKTQINEAIDPELKRKRIEKVWTTRRIRNV